MYTIKCCVHPLQFRNPDAVLVCHFTQPRFSLAHKIDGTKEMAHCFRIIAQYAHCFCIIAQYMVKTNFDDVLKILSFWLCNV